MESTSQSYWPLLLFIGLIVAAASTGAIFQPGAWYASLDKPSWTPPNWLFGPAWTVLYACIVAAAWLIWRETGSLLALPLLFWFGQVVFNALWSWLFFGVRLPVLALLDLLLMLACILAFIVSAWSVSRSAALLFVPYAVWVTFAGSLNFAIWRLNDWPQAITTGG
ncbi:MAG: TspO/MBR family protein [Pseudomonadota bacterium]